jgi:phage terminase small subunit
MNKQLTDKQQQFVQEYLLDYNATQAAIRAGYSEKTAKQQGSRLLTYVDVAAAVAELKKERLESMGVTQEGVLYDFAHLKNACMEPDEKGKPRDAANAVRCLGYLGNNLGLWQKEKYDDGGVEFVIKGLKNSDEDKDKIADAAPDNVVKLPA